MADDIGKIPIQALSDILNAVHETKEASRRGEDAVKTMRDNHAQHIKDDESNFAAIRSDLKILKKQTAEVFALDKKVAIMENEKGHMSKSMNNMTQAIKVNTKATQDNTEWRKLATARILMLLAFLGILYELVKEFILKSLF